MRRADAIVIGAGAAGLAAARVLGEAGLRVVVLEARRRIGGRIWTIRDRHARAPIEMGAEFIHGRPEATWALVREARLTAYDLPFEHWQKRRGRLVKIEDFSAELDEVMRGLAQVKKDESFEEYLAKRRGRRGTDAERMARAFVEGFDAADPRLVSAKSLAKEQEGLGDLGEQMQFRLWEGYGALVRHMRGAMPARVRIVPGMPVREVRWESKRVEARCDGGVFAARGAVVTMPIGVLGAKRALKFAPEIEEKRSAADKLASGPVVKAILVFDEEFWGEEAFRRSAGAESLQDAVFLHDPEQYFPTWWTMRPLRVPMLTGWAGGPRGAELGRLSDAQLREQAVRSLAGVLGVKPARIKGRLLSTHVCNWPADPWALGAYSYEKVGGAGARAELAKPVKGTLFFAGEATDTQGQASTVAGAIASGQRAGREAVRAFRSH